jgi:hypothetical protein
LREVNDIHRRFALGHQRFQRRGQRQFRQAWERYWPVFDATVTLGL